MNEYRTVCLFFMDPDDVLSCMLCDRARSMFVYVLWVLTTIWNFYLCWSLFRSSRDWWINFHERIRRRLANFVVELRKGSWRYNRFVTTVKIFFKAKIIFTDELRKKEESSQHLSENGLPLCKRNKPINDNIHESFTYRLRGEIQDETKDYLVEDHNESSLGAYFGTPVNLMILEKDYNCRWIPYDNPLCCTNNDAGELTTRDWQNRFFHIIVNDCICFRMLLHDLIGRSSICNNICLRLLSNGLMAIWAM